MVNIDTIHQATQIARLKNGELGKLRPLVHRGSVIPEYFIDGCGNVWSYKWQKLKQLTPTVAGNSKYPAVGLRKNGKQLTVDVHRIVAETYHERPIPSGITKEEWDVTPDSVKAMVHIHLQVNHIDHNVMNYHPDNLEWVTGVENNIKSHQYYHGDKSDVKSAVAEMATLDHCF